MLCCKTVTRAALCGAYKWTGLLRLHEALCHLAGQQFMTILLFHRVTDAIPEDVLTVSTARFRRICRMLQRGFRVVPLGEIFRIFRSGEPMPRRTLAVTFDDSYADDLLAARILSELGLPATFFVPTAFIGTNRVFEWDCRLPRLPNLSWEDLRTMIRLGHEIGSHSVTHANLGAVGPEQARTELFASRTILEEQISQPVRWFAYPFGGPNHIRAEYVPLIREAGYEGAVSAFGGFVEPHARACPDGMTLPREEVSAFRSVAHLEMFLSGCLHWLYALKGRRGWQGPIPSEDLALGQVGASEPCTSSVAR
jgi:peptidoglycan/xylan/chitin deacetylase (PgdA/CDA1 family)